MTAVKKVKKEKTMKAWNYREITKHATAQIKVFMGMSREMPTAVEAKAFSDIAFGIYFSWYMMFRFEPARQKAMKRDNARLLKLAGRSTNWGKQHVEYSPPQK